MADYVNFKSFAKDMNGAILAMLANRGGNVFRTVYEKQADNIHEYVYEVYDPKYYERQMESGGLTDFDSFDIVNVDEGRNAVTYRNVRPMDEGKDVASVVETGIGYNYPFAYFNRPRPFTLYTKNQLKSNPSILRNALADDLKSLGIPLAR